MDKQRWPQQRLQLGTRSFTYYRTGGAGPPLVLCHGITDNGLCWGRVTLALEDRFDIVMLDARGHGGSDRSPPTATSHVEDLAGALDALALERPALMGHSMGARTVAAYAAAYPDRVARLVLEDPPWREPEVGTQTAAERVDVFKEMISAFQSMSPEEAIARGRELLPSWHPDEFPAWAESTRQTALNVTDAVQFEPWQPTVEALHCPTLLVAGDPERGGIVTPELLEAAAAANPLVETAHLAGAGHNIRRERFDAFVAEVRRFLTS